MKDKTLVIISRLLIFLGVLILFAVAVFSGGCSEKQETPPTPDPDTIAEKLVVGMSCDNPPFGWIAEEEGDDTLEIKGKDTFAAGFDVTIAKALAKEMDVELTVKLLDRGDLIDAVAEGDIDLLIAGVNPLESRADRIAFSDAYYENEYVVIVKKDGAFANETSVAGFDGARLTAQNGSYIYDELLPQLTNAEVMPALTFHEDMRVALSNDVIDGYVTTLPEGMSATRLHPEYAMITFDEEQDFTVDAEFSTVAIGVATEKEKLLDAVNEALAAISPEERKVMMDRAIYAEPDNLADAADEEEALADQEN